MGNDLVTLLTATVIVITYTYYKEKQTYTSFVPFQFERKANIQIYILVS